jgi:hypothetical protein
MLSQTEFNRINASLCNQAQLAAGIPEIFRLTQAS